LVKGIGTDLIEVTRIEREMRTDGAPFRDSVFTDEEIGYCESKRFSARHYAARFAAKEAFFKALGTGWREGMAFKDVEVVLDAVGRPALRLGGRAREMVEERGITNVQVSLSHERDMAGAVVLLEE
jgi:holo-[acyl-carrier protein] synthase